MSEEPFFRIRAGRPGDHAFISESWLGSHAQTALGREMGPQYITDQKNLIKQILARPSTEVRMAVDKDDDDALFGFAVVGYIRTLLPRAYYCFVKRDSRRLGIAKALLADLLERQVVYTHKPPQRSVDQYQLIDSGKTRRIAAPIDWFDSGGVRVFPRDDVPIGEGWSGTHRDREQIGDMIERPKLWIFSYYRNWEP